MLYISLNKENKCCFIFINGVLSTTSTIGITEMVHYTCGMFTFNVRDKKTLLMARKLSLMHDNNFVSVLHHLQVRSLVPLAISRKTVFVFI